MSRLLVGAFLSVILASSAWAVPRAVPAPEIDAGILGMMAAGGIAYLISRRRRRT
jgi:ABC-type antimicrobial peptide transport system permease subunit